MRAEFIAATAVEQECTGGPVEICAVLNRLPRGRLGGSVAQVIDEVDALMDDPYRQGELVCPGHRWLDGPPPASIRNTWSTRMHAEESIATPRPESGAETRSPRTSPCLPGAAFTAALQVLRRPQSKPVHLPHWRPSAARTSHVHATGGPPPLHPIARPSSAGGASPAGPNAPVRKMTGGCHAGSTGTVWTIRTNGRPPPGSERWPPAP